MPPERRRWNHLISDSQWEAIAKKLYLTTRERQVCEHVFLDLTKSQIADALGIKLRTVEHYFDHINQKLGVDSDIGVVLRIIEVRDELGPDGSGESPLNPRRFNW